MALMTGACAGTSRLDRAAHVAGSAGRFSTGLRAGLAMAEVSSLLRADAEDCARRRPKGDARCDARFAASAYAQVAAVAVLRCTAPGRYDTRVRTARYLRAVARVKAGSPPPPVPPVPRCG